jgi:hypothetical protein
MMSAQPPLLSDSANAASDDLFESALGDDDSGLDGVGTNGDLTESSDRPKTGSDTMEDFSLQVCFLSEKYLIYIR